MPTRGDGRDRSFAALLHAYVEARQARGYSPHDRWIAERVLPVLFAHLEERGITDVRALTEGDLVSFLRSVEGTRNRRGNPFTEGQRTGWLAVLRSFFGLLEERHLILTNPAAGLRLRRAERLPPPVLSEAKARRLMAAPFAGSRIGQRDRAILELLYGTGLRLGECLRLDLPDVDLYEGQVLVKSGKGKKDRVVPLLGGAAKAMDLYLADVRPWLVRSPREEAVFLSRDGDRLSRTGLQARLRNYGEGIGLKNRLRPHVLRHTCATHLLQGGADIRHVQQLLGHRELRTTAIYTRVEVSDLREMLSRSHPREQRRTKRSRA